MIYIHKFSISSCFFSSLFAENKNHGKPFESLKNVKLSKKYSGKEEAFATQ